MIEYSDDGIKKLIEGFIKENTKRPTTLHVNYADAFDAARLLQASLILGSDNKAVYVSSVFPDLAIEHHDTVDVPWFLT